ncbi:PEP-CTERM sorting domain-containing protein [Massilia atriviolacea]|uniref:PEP-CTERM sorting domain-containing protein n=1 Tax=Massilia atriviolacea TaxID=2495579 RepID=A0A430HDE2_9BURK|nr:CCXG family PEP-CTERM protein [Massilia atriviolacea]RSZ55556.1 PEP-CTERM sorting domain-containing protein [Massilia atriviolacea]
MKKNLPWVLAAAALAVGGSVCASTITIESASAKPSGLLSDAGAYQSAVNAALQGPTYTKTTVDSYNNITHASLFGGSSNFALKSTINFGVTQATAGLWQFRAGVDFGYGGALFLNDVALDVNSHDMWWAGQYNNASQYFNAAVNLGAGNHTLTIFGFEGCCDGGQQAQFMAPGASFTSFSNTDKLISAVPEPETYAMFLTGMAMMAFLARRRQRQAGIAA